MDNSERIALHFKYCVLILVMVIIAVATDRWTAQKDFTTYLSNAATMTSLVLGLVAIFYSFISNDSLSKSLGSISTVSEEVRGTRDQIAEYVHLTKDATAASATNASLLKLASDNVGTSLASLSDTLKSVSEQNQTLQILVASLPSRIDQLETKVGDVAKALGEKPAQPHVAATSNEVSSRVIDRFLARPSLSYNLVTYAFVLSARTKKPISLESLCISIELNQPSTMNGFMLAMHAAQLLSRTSVENQSKIYRVTAIHPDLDLKTKKYIEKYLNENYSDKPNEKEGWLKKLINIESMFADEAPTLPP